MPECSLSNPCAECFHIIECEECLEPECLDCFKEDGGDDV